MSYRTRSGQPVTVGRLLARGGEGEVFAVTSPRGTVFKKYLPAAFARDPALENRLRAMVANPPAQWREPQSHHVTLAWPTDLILENGRFAGFLMAAVEMAETVEPHRVTNPDDRRKASGSTSWAQGFSWKYLIHAAVNLAQATQMLHECGVVIGDFNERNSRVTRDARITLLDCDSMQISDPVGGGWFFCRVGRPEYTPPELMHADWSKTVRHASSDLFALAIHIYQFLLEGEHPFRGMWNGPGDKPSVTELASQGVWAYKKGGMLRPRRSAIPADMLPDSIMGMFRPWCQHEASRTSTQQALPPVAMPTATQVALAPVPQPTTTYVPPAIVPAPRPAPNVPIPVTPVVVATPKRSGAAQKGVRAILIGAGLCLVAAIAIPVALSGVGAHTSAPGTVTSNSNSGTSGSNGSESDQATAMNSLLQDSSNSRTSVESSVQEVQNCSDIADGTSGLQQVVSERSTELSEADNLSTGAMPNGATLKSDLIGAIKNSLDADNDFLSWAQGVGGCSGSAPEDSNYQAAMNASSTAVSYKNDFVTLWNPIAQSQGFSTLTQADI